jgi:hypothetical protein
LWTSAEHAGGHAGQFVEPRLLIGGDEDRPSGSGSGGDGLVVRPSFVRLRQTPDDSYYECSHAAWRDNHPQFSAPAIMFFGDVVEFRFNV